MVVRVTHSKVSGKAQGSDPARVYGNHWDEDHVVEGLDIGSDVQAHDATLDALSGKSLTGAGDVVLSSAPVITAPTGIVKADVGLGNVDNTSDADKPVSTVTQAALDGKQPLDSDLTAIAALSTTSYGRSLLTLANATALAAEVDSFFLTPAEGNAAYQPLDSDLTAIAALTTTTYGREFLALVDASAARAAVGLANVDDTSDATKNAAAVTLTNKTLTGPKFASGGFIADANGNEEIVFTTTASAVNELTIANAATGAAPTITASGGDTNVGMSLVAKGTGNLSFMPITGQVTIGSLTGYAVNSEAGSAFTPAFQIHAAGAAATASITRWSANGNQGRFAFAKSRGAAIGTRGLVADGDSLGAFIFDGDDGTNFVTGAVITARISGTPGTNDMPTQLVFSTTPDGASTPTEWVSLGPTGELRVSDLHMLPGTAVPAGGAAGRGLRMSSTANLGIFFGSGVPTLSAAQGSLYIRTDGSSTSTRLYVNTNGTTGWTNFTSAT